jgi:hypothetical protein
MDPKTPNQTIEWQAPEYDHFEKDANWFWITGSIAVLFVLIAIILKNFLFAVILLVGGFTAMLYAARPPELIYFALTPKGVRIKNRLYPYDQLQSFWVNDNNRKRKIILESERFFLPHLIIPLPAEVSDEEARAYLLPLLAEVRHEESLADIIADTLGF